jgi:hypothetical protein
MNKSIIAAGVLALATAGSLTFVGGTALAGGCGCEGGGSHDSDTGGAGKGGTATNNCLNVGIPVLSGIGVAGSGSATGAACNATANGTGGAA